MTTVATLDPPLLVLPPGGEVSSTLTVHNRGDIVEGYHLEVLGEAAAWAHVEPSSLRVYPGSTGAATITFRMPGGVRPVATDIAFGIRVMPVERPAEVAVPEGVLRLGTLSDLTGELLPENSRTRRVATHEVAVDNLGNTPVRVELGAADADGLLDFRVRPDDVLVAPGQAAIAQLRLRHRKIQWRGAPTARRFQVSLISPDAPPVVLNGTSVQKPVLGAWLFKAAAALLVLALLLAGLWFGLLRPAVKSAANKAAKVAASQEAAKAAAAGGGGGGGGAKPTPSAAPSASPTPVPPVTPPVAGTVDFYNSLEITDAAGGAIATKPFPRPNAATAPFTVSWILLSATQGDAGSLEISAGDTVVMRISLINYRTNEFFPRPTIEVPANKQLTLKLNCTTVGHEDSPTASTCKALITVSGTYPKPAA
jgi:hypothetical protein